MEKRTGDSTVIHRNVMRQCIESDFADRGLKIEENDFRYTIPKRICPDVDDEMYKVQNDYTN